MDKPIHQIHSERNSSESSTIDKNASPALAQARRYSFGRFDYFPATHKLTYQNKPCHLDDKMLDLLGILIERRPNLVTKDELMGQLWPDTQVSDWSLARLVSDTRKILEDDGKSQSIIKTIRGKGFSFVAPIDEIIDATSQINRVVSSSQQQNLPTQLRTSHHRTIAIGTAASLLFLLTAIFLYSKFFATDNELSESQHKLTTNHQSKLHQIEAMRSINKNLNLTKTSFLAQARRRNELGNLLLARMPELETVSWEQRFRMAFSTLNADEKFIFDQVRAMTEGPIYQGNRSLLALMEAHPELYESVNSLTPLHAHLQIWLAKYEKVFTKRDDMAVLYVGVEDGVPFPSTVDRDVANWLSQNTASATIGADENK